MARGHIENSVTLTLTVTLHLGLILLENSYLHCLRWDQASPRVYSGLTVTFEDILAVLGVNETFKF